MAGGFRRDRSAVAKITALTEDALDEIAADVETYAKRLAPIDTGEMRSKIRTDSYPGRREIGAAVDYSEFVERGTSRQAAQPFLAPALYRHR